MKVCENIMNFLKNMLIITKHMVTHTIIITTYCKKKYLVLILESCLVKYMVKKFCRF